MKLTYHIKNDAQETEPPQIRPAPPAVEPTVSPASNVATTEAETGSGKSSEAAEANGGQVRTAESQRANRERQDIFNSLDASTDRPRLESNPIQRFIESDVESRAAIPSTIGGARELPAGRNFTRVSVTERITNETDLNDIITQIRVAINSGNPLAIETRTTGDAERLEEALRTSLELNPDAGITARLNDSSVVNPSPVELANLISENDKSIFFTTNSQVDFETRMFTAPSGTGLTFALAKLALEKFKQGEKIVILASHEHQQKKIAQAMLDFAEPGLREHLLAATQIIQSNTDTRSINSDSEITIASPKVLKTIGRRDGLGLENVQSILVDDAHSYITERRENSNGLILENILRETNSTNSNPTELISVSSTPSDFNLRDDADPTLVVGEQNIGPNRVTPDQYRTMGQAIEDNLIRDFSLVESSGSFADGEAIAGSTTLASRLQDSTSDGNLCSQIADWYETNAIDGSGKQKKFEVWVKNAAAANAVTKALKAKGIRAAELVNSQRGVIGIPLEEGSMIGYENDDPILSDRLTIDQHEILEEFSKEDGEFSVLVHCGDLLKGFNSPQTEGIIVADAISSESKLSRLVAAATSKADPQKADNRISQILCLDSGTKAILEEDIRTRPVNTLNLKSQSAGSSGGGTIAPADGEVAEIGFSEEVFSEGNRTWLVNYLAPILHAVHDNLNTRAAFDEAFNNLLNEYHPIGSSEVSRKEFEHIALGRNFNSQEFRGFANWLISHANYGGLFELDELISNIPNLTGVNDAREASLVTEHIYSRMTEPVGNSDWLNLIDETISNSDHSIANRAERIAEFGYQVFGEEYFTNPVLTEYLINIAIGERINPVIFNQFVEHIGIDLEQAESQFPDLIAGQNRQFDRLKEIITASYPEGPPEGTSFEEFFKQKLLELGITYPMLLRAADLGTNSQSIKQDLKEDLRGFLYQSFDIKISDEDSGSGEVEKKLRNEKILTEEIPKVARKKADDMVKAEPLGEVGQRLIYIKLAEKLWPNYEAAQTIDSESFEYKLDASAIEINSKDPNYGTTISPINLERGNNEWLAKLNTSLGGTRLQDPGLNQKQRELIGASMQEFLSSGPAELEALPRVTMRSGTRTELVSDSFNNSYLHNVLAGNVSSPDEQKVFRAYISWLEAQGSEIKLEDMIKEFPKLTGIETKEEARMALVHHSPNFSTATKPKKPFLATELNNAMEACGLSPEILIERGWIQKKEIAFFEMPLRMFINKYDLETKFGKGADDIVSTILQTGSQEEAAAGIQRSEILHLMGRDADLCDSCNLNYARSIRHLDIGIAAADNSIVLSESELLHPETGTESKYQYDNGCWYEIDLDSGERIDFRSASILPINHMLELQALFEKIIGSNDLKRCNEDWLTALDTTSDSNNLALFYLMLEFVGGETNFIQEQSWNYEKVFKILLGHEPSIKKHNATDISKEQELFRRFVRLLKSNLGNRAEVKTQIKNAVLENPQLMGISGSNELHSVINHNYPKFKVLNDKHETRIERDPAKAEENKTKALEDIRKLTGFNTEDLEQILEISDQAVPDLIKSVGAFNTTANGYSLRGGLNADSLRTSLIFEKLWDDCPAQPTRFGYATDDTSHTQYITPNRVQQFIRDTSSNRITSQYQANIAPSGAISVPEQQNLNETESILVEQILNAEGRAINDKTNAWLDLIDGAIKQDPQEAIPMKRLEVLNKFIEYRASLEPMPAANILKDIAIILNGERAEGNTGLVTLRDSIMRQHLINFINDNADAEGWEKITDTDLDAENIKALLPNKTEDSVGRVSEYIAGKTAFEIRDCIAEHGAHDALRELVGEACSATGTSISPNEVLDKFGIKDAKQHLQTPCRLLPSFLAARNWNVTDDVRDQLRNLPNNNFDESIVNDYRALSALKAMSPNYQTLVTGLLDSSGQLDASYHRFIQTLLVGDDNIELSFEFTGDAVNIFQTDHKIPSTDRLFCLEYDADTELWAPTSFDGQGFNLGADPATTLRSIYSGNKIEELLKTKLASKDPADKQKNLDFFEAFIEHLETLSGLNRRTLAMSAGCDITEVQELRNQALAAQAADAIDPDTFIETALIVYLWPQMSDKVITDTKPTQRNGRTILTGFPHYKKSN